MDVMRKDRGSPPRTQWRLIHTPPASGAWNMALDEAILESMAEESVLPTMRFYSWQPPCLSLGYAQPIADINQKRLQERGWDLVRRPTGGKAILHADELTYAVIGPQDEPRLRGGVLESYQRLSMGLLLGLEKLGLPVQVVTDSEGDHDREQPICFQNPSDFEITFKGKKLVGSAQARRKEGVLQHGTLPLHGDLARIAEVLDFSHEEAREEARERLLGKAINVTMIGEETVSWEKAAQAIAAGFEEALNIEFLAGKLTPTELDRAQILMDEKYQNPSWTHRL